MAQPESPPAGLCEGAVIGKHRADAEADRAYAVAICEVSSHGLAEDLADAVVAIRCDGCRDSDRNRRQFVSEFASTHDMVGACEYDLRHVEPSRHFVHHARADDVVSQYRCPRGIDARVGSQMDDALQRGQLPEGVLQLLGLGDVSGQDGTVGAGFAVQPVKDEVMGQTLPEDSANQTVRAGDEDPGRGHRAVQALLCVPFDPGAVDSVPQLIVR